MWQLLQIELEPEAQLLVLSFLDLTTYDFDKPTRKYTFALGLTACYLLAAEEVDATGEHQAYEFATWDARARGQLLPSEQIVPPGVLRSLTGFFSAEGAAPPLVPRQPPPRWLFRAVNPEAPLLCALA